MTLSMLLIGVIIVMLYYTGHLGELDTLFLLIWFIFPSLITGIVIAFLVAIKGLQPVLKMCDAITKVAEGDFSVRFKEKYLIYEESLYLWIICLYKMFQINGILVNEECKSCAMKEGLMAQK